MRRALQDILDSAKLMHPNFVHPTKDVVDTIIRSSQGDIRSAINTLEFVCSHPSKDGKGTKDRKKNMSRAMLEVVTRKENSFVLFHLMGKVMYNKR
jgi:cell cycle checkpoint protein